MQQHTLPASGVHKRGCVLVVDKMGNEDPQRDERSEGRSKEQQADLADYRGAWHYGAEEMARPTAASNHYNAVSVASG